MCLLDTAGMSRKQLKTGYAKELPRHCLRFLNYDDILTNHIHTAKPGTRARQQQRYRSEYSPTKEMNHEYSTGLTVQRKLAVGAVDDRWKRKLMTWRIQ